MQQNKEPLVTIIVPFIEYDDYTKDCIKHIFEQEYKNFELILILDYGLKIETNKKIKVIIGGKNTISLKRNLGIKASNKKTKYLAFIDSDAFPEKNWLKDAINILESNQDLSAIGGPNILPPNSNWKETCASNAISSPFISGLKFFQNKISKDRYVNDLPTCNLIVKKVTLDKIGLFNESLMTGEDLDLCERIRKDQKKIFFSKNVIVYHHRRKLWQPFFKQRFIYGVSIFRILKSGIKKKNLYLLMPPLVISYIILGIIISLISKIFMTFFIITILLVILLSLIEGFRNSKKLSHGFITSLTIFIAIFTPGIGSFYGLIKGFNTKKMYENRN